MSYQITGYRPAQALRQGDEEGGMGAGKEDCEGANSAGIQEIQGLSAAGELGLLPVHGGARKEAKMKSQPGLKITAQGIVPDWFSKAKAEIEASREALKRDSRNTEDLDCLVSIEEARERIRRQDSRQGI